jgi:alpha-beta hydrolase superfamily lysophospholipase
MKRTTVLLTVLFTLLTTLSLTGCSSVRNLMGRDDAAAAPVAQGNDITLPPTIPRAESDRVVETRPEDTISFDEWRKQREESFEAEKQAKAKAQAKPEILAEPETEQDSD